MFRNKILLRAQPPFPPFSSFSLRQLNVSHPFPFPPSLSSILQTLCWKLSRKWHLACFSDSSEIYIVYQKTQSDSAAQVVKEIKETLPVTDVVACDGEGMSGSLISKAVDCGLRSVLLESNWKCVGDGYIFNSTFSYSEEKRHIYALHVTIQVDTDDGFVVLVSPDVVRFGRHKIMDLLSSEMQRRFHGGEEVILDNYGFVTSCSVLPSLCEGHVIGLSKLLPSMEDLEHMEELWSFKHGLMLPNDYFVNVQFIGRGHTNKQWFPSAFVLQGSGLNPVPQTIRASNAICALESFVAVIEAWNFFDGGLLKIKGACRLGISSDDLSWTKAPNNNGEQLLTAKNNPYMQTIIEGKVPSFKSLLSTLDFRTPKPASGLLFGRETSEHNQIQESTLSLSKGTPSETCTHSKDVVSVRTSAKLKPLFMNRVPATRGIHSGHTIPSSAKSGNESDRTCQLSVTGSKTIDLQKDKSFQKPIAEKHGSPEALTNGLNPKKHGAIQEGGVCQQISSKTLRQKEVKKGLNNCLEDTKKVLTVEAQRDFSSNKQEKNKPKKRSKHHIDPSDITSKVNDHHARGQLGSLTVPELKSFLGMRKAKVGGKKEELIQRIVTLLA